MLYTLVLVASVICCLWALESFRRPGISRKSALAAFLAGPAAAVLFYLALLEGHYPAAAAGMLMLSVLFWAATGIGMLLAILGLKETGDPQNNLRGQPFAWAGFALALLFQFLIGHAVYANIAPRLPSFNYEPLKAPASVPPAPSEEKWMTLEDLNFRFRHPGPGWVEMNLKSLHPNAVVGFARFQPQTYFMISVEKAVHLGETHAEFVADLVAEAISQQFPGEIGKKESWERGDLKGFRFIREARVQGTDFRYLQLVVLKNGYLYHFMFWQDKAADEAELYSVFDAFMPLFEILDPSRQASGDFLTQTQEDPAWGFRIQAGGKSWFEAPELKDHVTQAHIALMHESRTAFYVIPVALAGIEPPVHLLAQAFLSLFEINYQSIPMQSVQEIESGPYSGLELLYRRTLREGDFLYRFRILQGKNRAFLIVVVRNLTLYGEDETLMQEAVSLFDPIKKPAEIILKNLSPLELQTSAYTLHQMAEILFQQGNVPESLPYYKKVHELLPGEEAPLTNLLGTYVVLNQMEEAYGLIQSQNQIPENRDFKLLQARILYETGRAGEARQVFEKLLETGVRDQAVINGYAELLAEMGEHEEAVRILDKYLALEENVDMRLLRLALIDQSENEEAAVREAGQLYERYPFNPQVRDALFNILDRYGRYEDFLVYSEQAVAANRADAQLYFYQAVSEFRLKRFKDSMASLETALKKNPYLSQARQMLEDIRGLIGSTSADEVRAEIPPVETIEMFSGAERDQDLEQRRKSYYPEILLAVHYPEEGSLRTTTRQIVRILNREDLEAFSEMEIEYDSFHEKLHLNRVVVRDASGKVLRDSVPEDLYVVDDSDSGMASHNKILHIPVAGLEIGSTLEIMYTKEMRDEFEAFPYQELILMRGDPIRRYRVVLTGRLEDVKTRHYNGVREESGADKKIWTMENIPAWEHMDYLPDVEFYLPMIKMAHSRLTWAGLGAGYLEEIKGLLPVENAVAEQAKEILRGAGSVQEKVEAAGAYIRRNFSYNAIEFGARGMVPKRSSEFLREKYGDCKDHSLLMLQMLRSQGVEAYLALVDTDGTIESEVASLDSMDHMLLYIPGYGPSPFVDATAKQLEPGLVPELLIGRQALVLVPEGESYLKTIEAHEALRSHLHSKREIRIVENDMQVFETLTTRGYLAADLRGALAGSDPDKYLAWFQQALSKRNRHLQLQKIDIENMAEPSLPLVIRMEYLLSNSLHHIDDKMSGKIPAFWEEIFLALEFDEKRPYPFEFQTPFIFENEVLLHAPEGYAWRLKETRPFQQDSPYFKLAGRLEGNSKTVGLSASLHRRAGRFAAGEYRKAYDDTQEALRRLQPELILEKS